MEGKESSGGDGSQTEVASSKSTKTNLQAIKRILRAVPVDQLIDLLAMACAAHSDVETASLNVVAQAPVSRRLMIRNIAFKTSDECLYNELDEHGEIEDFTIVRDKDNKRSKGFGFVTYKTGNSVMACLQADIRLDGRNLLIKLASEFSQQSGSPALTTHPERRTKLFVRGLHDETTKQSLHSAFEIFGPVDNSVVVRNVDGSSRGYGFVVFEYPESAAKAAAASQLVIDDRMVFISYAIFSRTSHSLSPSFYGEDQNRGQDLGRSEEVLSSYNMRPQHYYSSVPEYRSGYVGQPYQLQLLPRDYMPNMLSPSQKVPDYPTHGYGTMSMGNQMSSMYHDAPVYDGYR